MAIAGAVNGSAPVRITTNEMDMDPVKIRVFPWLNHSAWALPQALATPR
jgi:hypothetical protein